MKKKKEIRGGARKGAGRPKRKEDTVVMRVPLSLVDTVKQLIINFTPEKCFSSIAHTFINGYIISEHVF